MSTTTKPAVNPDPDAIADLAKSGYAEATQKIAQLQYALAELACTGKIDRDTAKSLQHDLVEIWESVYFGTTAAVRDWDTDDDTWDEADNTYSDGRTVVTKTVVDPDAEEEWAYNPFLSGDGAVNEFKLGVVYDIAKPGERAYNL